MLLLLRIQKLLKIFFIINIVVLINCKTIETGTISFYEMNEKEYSELQTTLFSPKMFTKNHVSSIFSENKTIWYYYESHNPQWNQTYAISLSRKNNVWEEIALNNEKMPLGRPYLIGKYKNLQEGEYQIRVITNKNIVNTTFFTIARYNENLINYEDDI